MSRNFNNLDCSDSALTLELSCPNKLLNSLILRDHGMSAEKRYWHDRVGYNYRLTNLQAAIGVAQMEKFSLILDNLSFTISNGFNLIEYPNV